MKVNMPFDLEESKNYQGALVRIPGPFGEASEEQRRLVQEFSESLERGLTLLDTGSAFAPDLQPVEGATVQTFDLFDVFSGDHVMIWRVECRKLSKTDHAARDARNQKEGA